MPIVEFTGWKYGLRKVSLNRVFRDSLGMPASQAFASVNTILDGKLVRIEIDDPILAQEIVDQCTLLGAVCGLACRRPEKGQKKVSGTLNLTQPAHPVVRLAASR